MRILQILHNRKFGGAEQHLVQLCIGLRAAGHEVEAAVPKGSRVWLRLEEAGFVLHDFDFRAHYDLPALLRLLVLIKRQDYDLVHTTWCARPSMGGWPADSFIFELSSFKT